MADNVIKRFRISGQTEVYEILPDSAETANVVGYCESANTATSAKYLGDFEEGIYCVEQADYNSETGTHYRGIHMQNGIENEGFLCVNAKGNMLLKSMTKHINMESAKGIQYRATTSHVFDSAQRIEKNKGNEINFECRFDDYAASDESLPAKYFKPDGTRKDGADEQWAEVKLEGRNFDIRCHDHGGIALQPCGKDHNNFENKIKFESSRKSEIGAPAEYQAEGGKGLEFGTFNNLHTSLYTGDYRFKGNAKVYGVSRGPIEVSGDPGKEKYDYPTQADDFKDIIPTEGEAYEVSGATWNEIVKVARNYADGKISGGGSGGTIDPEVWAQRGWVEENFAYKTDVPEGMAEAISATTFMKSRLFQKTKNGNLEVSAEGLKKWDEETHIETDEPASLDLVSDGKVAIKGDELAMENNVITISGEINKNGKVKAPWFPETGKNKTLDAVRTAVNDMAEAGDFELQFVIGKNEFGDGDSDIKDPEIIAAVKAEYPEGKVLESFNFFDIFKMFKTYDVKDYGFDDDITTPQETSGSALVDIVLEYMSIGGCPTIKMGNYMFKPFASVDDSTEEAVATKGFACQGLILSESSFVEKKGAFVYNPETDKTTLTFI